MTIWYSIKEEQNPWRTMVILSHKESGLESHFQAKVGRTQGIQEIAEFVDKGFNGFAVELSRRQAALAESDDIAMRIHYDKYLKGMAGSYRTVDAATADLVHGRNVPPDASAYAVELPAREDTFKRRDVELGKRGPSNSLFAESAYVTQAAGDRIVTQLHLARVSLLQEIERMLYPQMEIEHKGHSAGMLQMPRPTFEGQAKEEGWPLLEYDPKKNTISSFGSVQEVDLERFNSELDRIDREVSNANGRAIQQPKSQNAKNAKNPRFWAHRAEDRLNGILVQAEFNLPENDPTRQLLKAVSEMFSDHIHGLGE